jgi:hypothetical protein
VFRAKQCDHALLFFVNKKLKMVNGRKSIMLNGYGGGRDTRRFEMNGVTEIRPLVLSCHLAKRTVWSVPCWATSFFGPLHYTASFYYDVY